MNSFVWAVTKTISPVAGQPGSRGGRRISIRARLIGGFLIVVALLLVVFGFAYNGLSAMGAAAEHLFEETDHADRLMEIKALVANEWQFYTDYSLTHNDEALGEAQALARQVIVETAELLLIVTAEEAVEINDFLGKHAIFGENGGYIAELYVGGDWYGGNIAKTRWNYAGTVMLAAFDGMQATSTQSMAAAMASADSAESSAITITIIIAVIAALVAVGLGFFLSQQISKGVSTIASALKDIAQGDLSAKVSVSSKDEIGDMADSYTEMQGYLQGMAGAAESIAGGDLTVTVQPKSEKDSLGNAFSEMLTNLTTLIGQVRGVADNVSTASEQLSKASEQAGQATQQIASTSQQVARGAGEQSTSLQQTTEGMEQLARAVDQIAQGSQEQSKGVERTVAAVNQVSTSVSQVAENASAAAEGSQNAAEAAQKGATMAQQTVEGMGKIKSAMDIASSRVTELGERSDEIGKIVATIDDIAAQTNLLALNAAIEAARAGEQGRGFAVVADEVRRLAERSSGATKEIADLISGIQQGVTEAVKAMEDGTSEVDGGYKLATDAGESLNEILETVSSVGKQVEQIAGAAQELSGLSAEMVTLTDGVSSVVEENTAATEEMSASSAEVSKSIESVAGVSQQNSAATQQVSASAEEMSAQVEEVVASSQSLAEMSAELQKNVAQFKLN